MVYHSMVYQSMVFQWYLVVLWPTVYHSFNGIPLNGIMNGTPVNGLSMVFGNTDIIINIAASVPSGEHTCNYTQLVLTLARRNANMKNYAGLLHFSLFK